VALIDLLDRPIAYHRVFRTITGNTVAAIMLSQAVYWQRIADSGNGGRDGWWWKEREDWEAEIGLSRSEQETARKRLIQLGVMKEQRRGVPPRMWYRVNFDVLEEKLQEYQQNAGIQPFKRRESSHLKGDNPAIYKAGFQPYISKTTSKITSKNTSTHAHKPKTREGGTKNVVEPI
jgi:hypothetical protein